MENISVFANFYINDQERLNKYFRGAIKEKK
jgi:hypothetical protein